MANPHINYATFKSRFGDLGITEWTKYNYLSNYNFGLPAQTVPSDYLELEWIKGDGASRIDTGIYIAPRMQIITDIIPDLSHMSENCVFGAEWIVSGWLLTFFRDQLRMHNGQVYVDSDTITAAKGTLHIHAYDYATYGKLLEINGVNYTNITDTGVEKPVSQPITLFNAYVPDTTEHWKSTRYGYHKLIKHEVYVDGQLVQSLVPVRRLSDGAVGMYDKVSGRMLTNNGTGSFTAGPMKQRYVRVEYVEFHGNDYIDTGLVSKLATYIQDADIQFTQFSSGLSQFNGADYGVYFGIGSTNNFAATSSNPLSPNIGCDIQRHHFVQEVDPRRQHNWLYIDNVKYSSNRIAAWDINKNLSIGSLFGSAGCYEKVYRYAIYEDDVLLRNFIPVYDLRDQKYGLYDLVEGKFYESGNNLVTGPFTGCIYLNALEWTQSTFIDYAWYANAGVTYNKNKINEFLLVSPLYHYIGGTGGTRYLADTDKAVAVFNAVDSAYEVYYSNQDGPGSLIGTYLFYK